MLKKIPVPKKFVPYFQDEDTERIVLWNDLMYPLHQVLDELLWFENIETEIMFFTFESAFQKVQRQIGTMEIVIENDEVISVKDNREKSDKIVDIAIEDLDLTPRIHIVNFGYRKLEPRLFAYGWQAFILEGNSCQKILDNGSCESIRKILAKAFSKNITNFDANDVPQISRKILREELRENLPSRSVGKNNRIMFHAVMYGSEFRIIVDNMSRGHSLV